MTENMVTIKGTNGEFTLEGWQVEAAYRHQLHEDTVMDAEEYVSEYLESYNSSVGDTRKLHIKPTEEDYENLAFEFLEQYDSDISDNTRWAGIIERHFGLE